MIDKATQSKLFKEYETLLEEGKIDDAYSFLEVNGIHEYEADPVTNRVFESILKSGNPALAIKIGRKFKLDPRKIQDAGAVLFRQYLSKDEPLKALKTGDEFRLGKGDIHKAVLKYFHQAIKKKEYKAAVEVTQKYQIPHDTIYPIAIKGFNDAIKRKDHYSASFLGREFQLARNRITKVAAKAIRKIVSDGEFDKLFNFHQGFDIFSNAGYDALDDKECDQLNKSIVSGLVSQNLSSNNTDKLLKLISGFRIFDKKYKNKKLVALIEEILKTAVKHHNHSLEKRSISEARVIRDGFNLISDEVPFEVKSSAVDQAQKMHVIYVNEKNYQAAKTLKEEYLLFGKNSISNSSSIAIETASNLLSELFKKGDLDEAVKVVKDYQMPLEIAKQIALEQIGDLIKQKRIEDAVKGVKTFKIPVDEPRLLKEATIVFDNAIDSQLYEQAAEIGHHFKLQRDRTVKAAYNAWKRHLDYGRFDTAVKMYKIYRIPRKIVLPIVNQMYNNNLSDGKIELAKKIREMYGIRINFIQWFQELIKKIFNR